MTDSTAILILINTMISSVTVQSGKPSLAWIKHAVLGKTRSGVVVPITSKPMSIIVDPPSPGSGTFTLTDDQAEDGNGTTLTVLAGGIERNKYIRHDPSATIYNLATRGDKFLGIIKFNAVLILIFTTTESLGKIVIVVVFAVFIGSLNAPSGGGIITGNREP